MLVYLWVIHYPAFPLGDTGIIIGLIGVVMDPRSLTVPRPLLWFGAFVLWAGIGSAQSSRPDLAFQGFVDYLKLWCIFFLTVNVARNRAELRTLTLVWLGLFAFYPVRGTLFNIAFGISRFGRYAWNNIFANPNDLAALTIPMLALCIGLLQTERHRWMRLAAKIGVAILPVIILFTQSRGGILALALFTALVIVGERRRGRVLVVAGLVLGLITVSVPSSVWDRLAGLKNVTDTETLQQADVEGSADQRYEIWKVAVQISKDHPVFGIGAGTYPQEHLSYTWRGGTRFRPTAFGKRDTHSTFLNALAENGILGLILFLGMLGSVFYWGWRTLRQVRHQNPLVETQLRTLLIGLIAFLQTGLFATVQHVAFLYLYLGILCTYLRLAPTTPTLALPARRGGRRVRAA